MRPTVLRGRRTAVGLDVSALVIGGELSTIHPWRVRLQILKHHSPPGSMPRERLAPPRVLSPSGAREHQTQTG
jgi:hypothetical protein